jgi:hypothetical protein
LRRWDTCCKWAKILEFEWNEVGRARVEITRSSRATGK